MKLKKHTYLIAFVLAVSGVLLILSGILLNDYQPAYFWRSLLLNTIFFTTVSLFGILFYSMHILANAKWISKIQIVLVSTGEVFVFILLFYFIMFFKLGTLFEWVENIGEKSWYLNIPFFIIRNIIILGGLALLTTLITRKSYRINTSNLKTLSAIFLMFFGVVILFYAYDWIVSLDMHWYSTLYGWYLFSGLLVAGLSATVIISLAFDKQLGLNISLKVYTYLAKYLFAFSMIWAYLWYVQYLLVWYVNKPTETGFYTLRLEHYSVIFYAGFLASFVIPFILLLANRARGNKTILLIAAISGIIGQWLDKAFYILPVVESGITSLLFIAIGIFILISLLFLIVLIYRLNKKIT